MKSLPQNIRNEIEGLAAMDARKLRRAYGDLLTDATACKSSSILRQLVAYRLQERFYGISLSKEAREWMSQESEGAKLGINRKGVGTGARIVRVWKGETHEVFVLENGRYEHKGTVYKSLSAVARAITGTQWNGKLFFGVKS